MSPPTRKKGVPIPEKQTTAEHDLSYFFALVSGRLGKPLWLGSPLSPSDIFLRFSQPPPFSTLFPSLRRFLFKSTTNGVPINNGRDRENEPTRLSIKYWQLLYTFVGADLSKLMLNWWWQFYIRIERRLTFYTKIIIRDFPTYKVSFNSSLSPYVVYLICENYSNWQQF